MDNILDQSVQSLIKSLQRREITSQNIVEAHLHQIENVNPTLNAVVQLTADTAMAEAEKADTAFASGKETRPLHGIPFTVKDWIETKGVICAAGYEERKDFVPQKDATVVARLRAAGAILLGKSNVGSNNRVYGKTFNPYRINYSPAGSSSGEAAIIASGGSPLGLGSDSGGSIRQPAHCCGIVGLRPTTGRVPLTGHYPPIIPMNDPRTQIGPMARYVEDLALVLPIISGADWQDTSVIPMPIHDLERVELGALKCAFYADNDKESPTEDTVKTFNTVIEMLRNEDVTLAEAMPNCLGSVEELTLDYWRRSESEDLNSWQPDGGFDPENKGPMQGEEVEKHLFYWDKFRREMLSFIEQFDVIITPASNSPAVPHGQAEGSLGYMLPYSLAGYPCVVVRGGTSVKGLPIGVQVISRPWREDVALAVASVIEDRLGGWVRPSIV